MKLDTSAMVTEFSLQLAAELGCTRIDCNVMTPAEQWERIVRALVSRGFAIERDTSQPGDIEAKIQAVLAEMAPPGTPFTSELEQAVRLRLLKLLTDEFASRGMSEEQAGALAALVVTAAKLRRKEEP